MYAAATAGKPAAALQLPERLLQLLKVAGQHLYHNVPGGCTCLLACLGALDVVLTSLWLANSACFFS